MAGQVIQSVWLPLAILGYFLITSVLTVLTSARRRSLEIHDRVRECMALRNRFRKQEEEKEQLRVS